MKFNKDFFGKRWVSYTVALCAAVVLYLFLANIGVFWSGLLRVFNFIYPVFIGLCIAYLLNPVVDAFEKFVFKKIKKDSRRRGLSVFVGVVFVLVAISAVGALLIPQIASSVVSLVTNIDTYITSLQTLLNEFIEEANASIAFDLSSITNISNDLLDTLLDYVKTHRGKIIDTTVGVGKNVATSFIAFIVAIYFLADKRNLMHGFSKMIRVMTTEKKYETIADFWSRCNKILSRFIAFDILDAIIVGVVNFIFMAIANMPFIALISVVVAVANLAPTFGPIVGCLVSCFILVLVNPWQALIFLIFTLILQTVDGYIIKPKLFGGTFGVSSVWILVAIVVFGRMFGVIGILLAIPLAAIIDYIYKDYIWVELAKRKKERGEKVPD
ncbi:MAG: AI-2E family transporter [Eubacterium sp.]|nr:AI-2E family transporter [Eubacterium sp.]